MIPAEELAKRFIENRNTLMISKEELAAKCSKIKFVLTDVDGVLTNGNLYFSTNGEISQGFHVHDGYGVKQLLNQGFKVGILSSRNSSAVGKRMRQLGIDLIWQGVENKLTVFNDILKNLQLNADEVCYLGDDVPDMEVLQAVGLSVTVANAHPSIIAIANWQTSLPGGSGAFRELADMILQLQT